MGAFVGRRVISISEPQLTRDGDGDGGWRVSARVGDDEVPVASDGPLAANADAFVAAYFLAAAKAGATLRVDADLDAGLHGNLEGIQAIAGRYWGFPGANVVTRDRFRRTPAGERAIFFTGGVDSFYALRRLRGSIDRLIFVDGFDLGLEDRAEFARARAAIEAVAAATGTRAAFPRTNLRRDPTFRTLGWDLSFGSALAAVAHAMSPAVAEIHVPSSAMETGYGSTPELDALWSSGAVTFVHRDVGRWRIDKVRELADWPLAHRYLRVCFAPRRGGRLNCGTCEKCVRTQVAYETAGARDRLETFPRANLRELIDGVPYAPPVNYDSWVHIRPFVSDREIDSAIGRLLARRPGVGKRLRDAVRPWLVRLPGGRIVRTVGRRLLSR